MSSPQPISIDKYPVETSGTADSLVFGEYPNSSLIIAKTLLTRLWDHVREGIRSLTRGGLEVGGLLVGHKIHGGGVVIEDIVPLPIEYRLGPAFHMSASDLATIAPTMEVARRAGKMVVGFYRSRTRGDGMFRETDLEILEAIQKAHRSYDEDFRCCFVLAPKSLSLAIACVALRSKNGWVELPPATLQSNPIGIVAVSLQAEGKAAHTPVPISDAVALSAPRVTETRVTVAEHRVTVPETRVTVSETRVTAPENRVSVPENHTPPVVETAERARKEGIWWYGALAVVAAAALWLAFRQVERAPTLATQDTARTHLGFSATPAGPVWKLTWNPGAMDTLNPIGGVLSIDDGTYAQEVPLAPPDLASGTMYYTPQQSGSLLFSLRIDRGGSHVEEHVRVVVAPVLDQVAGRNQNDPNRPAPPPRPAAAPTPAYSPQVSTNAPATNSPEPVTEPRAERTAKAFRIPVSQRSKGPAPNTPSDVEAPPNVEIAAAQPPRPAPLTLAIPVPPPNPEPPAPSPQPATAPAAASSATAAGAPAATPVAAAAPTAAKSSYLPPKPLQQTRPQLPANMPTGVNQVQIQVEIDPRGKVIQATPIGWSATNAPLMVWAVRAVSSWVFEPARLNGKPVQSQMNLIFKF
jgi:hypothetical protein